MVYCNCDDYRHSQFVEFFINNFEGFQLRRLVATAYNPEGCGLMYLFDGINPQVSVIEGDGSYRSEACMSLLREADIVVTNPPFSIFREYIDTLMSLDKKFIVIGNNNAITCKNMWNYFTEGKLWFGIRSNFTMRFRIPNDYENYSFIDENGVKYTRLSCISWYTNVNHGQNNPPLELTETYEEGKYDRYENYDAIEVPRNKLIPKDYNGVMGVSITLLNILCKEQFEVIGITSNFDCNDKLERIRTDNNRRDRGVINGKRCYARILIKKR